MTQDLIVTLVAALALAIIAMRYVRRRTKPQGTCASCEASPAPTSAPPAAAEPEVKPLAFFGSRRKST